MSSHLSPPHFEDPLAAPRPHRLIPDLPANMAQSLNNAAAIRAPSVNQMPGFAFPGPDRMVSPLPPPRGSDWSPWSPPPPAQHQYNISPHPPRASGPPWVADPLLDSKDLTEAFNTLAFTPSDSPVPSNASLTAPLPSVQSLTAAISSIQGPSASPAAKISWSRDTLLLVERLPQHFSDSGTLQIDDPQLLRLIDTAIAIVLQLASLFSPGSHVAYAEALYLRATLASSGAHPQYVPRNPRNAFKDFEQAAKGGYSPAWFRLGRDYEGFGDDKHARECFDRGARLGVECCLYRMGMAHLMGQLGLPPSQEVALPLLLQAAKNATVQVAQPAYVYGLLLLNEFSHVQVPPHLFNAVIPPGSTIAAEARKYLERAAYLNYCPAQYKLGHAYEFADPPFQFDPLLSVQYYSLASQQGEIEADMALSKWFLCGAQGVFDMDESLAFTFAEKAARKGLASAEFAMGYYAEVGVGGPKDLETAKKWYTKAMQHGNNDAAERLSALSQLRPQALSREEHEVLTENKLVRKRTQAKLRSEAVPGRMPSTSSSRSKIIIDNARVVSSTVRKNSTGPDLDPIRRPLSQSSQRTARSPKPYPPGQQQGAPPAFPQRQRISLADTGPVISSNGPGPGPGPRPHSSYSHSDRASFSEPQTSEGMSGPPKKGPQTFQDMGFESRKLQDKECVIM